MKKMSFWLGVFGLLFGWSVVTNAAEVIGDAETVNAYRIIQHHEIPYTLMGNGVVDGFLDASGIDSGVSGNEVYTGFDVLDATQTHTVTRHGDTILSNSIKQFGNAGGEFDGVTDYLTAPDSTDWDMFTSNADNWTVDFWVKHNNPGNGGVGTAYEVYVTQYEGGIKRWLIDITTSQALRFFFYNNSGVRTVLQTANSVLTDTNWHHIAMVKIGSNYALYLDGNQEAYMLNTDTSTGYAADLTIGCENDIGIGEEVDGYMDEFRIQHSNPFNVTVASSAPGGSWMDNTGSHNGTITVPNAPYTPDANTKILLHMDSTSGYFTPAVGTTMNLISNTFAAATAPSDGKIVVLAEDTQALINAGHITAKASCDAGSTQSTITLTDVGEYEAGKHVLSGALTSLGCGGGDDDMQYELITNNDDIRIYAVGFSWE